MSQQTFDSLIRQKRPVQKSRGGVIADVPEWRQGEHPFTGVVMAGLKARFARGKPIEHEVKVVKGRRTDFTDLVTSRASGYHAVRSDQDGFVDHEDLANVVTDFLDALDTINV